jgi:hypothetical protein
MNNNDKQKIINDVTNVLRNRQWFAGAGFENETLIIAFNFYPAFEILEVKEAAARYGVQYELKDIKHLRPDLQHDDVPSYMR